MPVMPQDRPLSSGFPWELGIAFVQTLHVVAASSPITCVKKQVHTMPLKPELTEGPIKALFSLWH